MINNKKLEDIQVWITAIFVPIVFICLLGSVKPLGMLLIGLLALGFLSYIFLGLIKHDEQLSECLVQYLIYELGLNLKEEEVK